MVGDRDWSAPLYLTAHGQCFGCPYSPAQLIPAGTVSLHFTSSQTAVLTVNGFSVSVSRMDFWLNNTVPDAMLGEWSAVIGAAFDIFDGERIDYRTKGVDSTGIPYAGGSRLGTSSSTNAAMVEYNFSTGSWSALLDSSASYYRLFVFNMTGFNRVEGTLYIYLKGTNPGAGLFYQAFRTASAALIQTGSGPGSTKRAMSSDQLAQFEIRDARLVEQLSAKGVAAAAADSHIVEIARSLEARLAEYRRTQE